MQPSAIYSPSDICCIFAVDEQKTVAPSAGTATHLLIFSDQTEIMEPIMERPLSSLLLSYRNSYFFCNGIGNCLNTLLELKGIHVIPGCSGRPEEILCAYRDHTLITDRNPYCSDHGRTCGSCPGKF